MAKFLSMTEKVRRDKLRELADTQAATDSYSNGPARIGAFTGNLSTQGLYPLTRFTQQYMELLAMYRSHWIVRKVVDVLAEDMLKDAPQLNIDMKPEQIKKFDLVLRKTATIEKLIMALKWGRLFGGGVAVICIEGHDDLAAPLLLDDVELGSYKGLIALDRWSGVFPDSELISEMDNPAEFGLPRSYTCTFNSSVAHVHHSRIIRFVGRPLPEWERQVEMYWGLSEVEVILDELQKRDYSSWNIVSLITRAQLLAVKDTQLAQKMSGASMNNASFNQYLNRMDAMAQSMNNQGLLVVGEDGGIEATQFSFGGLAEIYSAQMADIAGAAEIPMSRLYGRTTSGLGTSGEGDLQIYYDLVETKRKREVYPAMDKLLPIIAMSTFGKVPTDFDYTFQPVRTMNNKERAELAKNTSESIIGLYEADLLTKKQAVSEVKQAADENGLGSNITDEDVAATPNTYASEAGGGELEIPDFPIEKESTNPEKTVKENRFDKPLKKAKAANDASAYSIVPQRGVEPVAMPVGSEQGMLFYHGLPVAIETRQGGVRRGLWWKVRMPADYGYIEGVTGADGDEIDCYVGVSPESSKVFVVDQDVIGKPGSFDEHKVMLGYHTLESAQEDYLLGHHKGNEIFAGITEYSMPQFRQWMATADLTKPASAA